MKIKAFLAVLLCVFLASCGLAVKPSETLVGECAFVVDCGTILKNKDTVKSEVLEFVPDKGIIFESEVEIYEGDTPYSVLLRVCKENKIKYELTKNVEGTPYITGINNISSGDFGELSGWLYYVNDNPANEASDKYVIEDGDKIEWLYTCEMGNDL